MTYPQGQCPYIRAEEALKAHTDAQRRRRRCIVGRVLVLNIPPARHIDSTPAADELLGSLSN
jgi:hypothetical protein